MSKIILGCFLVMGGFCFAGDVIQKPKNCEVLRLSVKVDIISCENLDYLIEYDIYDEKRAEVIKVTAMTPKDVRVVKSK